MKAKDTGPLYTVYNHTFENIPIDLVAVLKKVANAGFVHPLEITLVDREEIAKVNLQYTQKAYPADTLAFEPFFDGAEGLILLCPREIEIFCLLNTIPLKVRWTHLIVHSSLHCHGLDHRDQKQFEKMLAQERKILAQCCDFQGYFLTESYTYIRYDDQNLDL